MKKLFLAALMMCGVVGANAQMTKNFIDQNYVEVSGYNKTEIAPDMIYIEFQISEADSKGKTNIDKAEKDLIKALEAIGVDVKKQLTINDMSNSMKKYILKQQQVMNARSYTLLTGGAAEASKAFDVFDKQGISTASISKIDHTKMEDLKLESRAEAVKAAKRKAGVLATAAGRTCGKALYIQDTERTYTPMYANSIMVKRTMDSAVAESSTDLEFQKMTIESNVTVYFALD